ncbi:hypothetical protein [Profundibacter sp.]
MRRVVIHAGFHKTGTTTAQRFLMHNGEHIWPHHAIAIQHRIRDPLQFALSYSTGAGQIALDEFRSRFRVFLETLNLGAERGLIISAENLAGMMPGKNALVEGYTACPVLMKVVAECIEQVIDPNPDMTFHFSTRGKDAWLRSIWWHNLSKTRLTDNFNDFADALGPTCDLENTVQQVRKVIAPYPVTSMPLEQTTGQKFGPATPLIDLLNLPDTARNALQNIPAENVMPSRDLVKAFLKLNRSDLSNPDLVAAKQELLERAAKLE